MNSRLDEIQAAVLRVKLARLDRMNERRREIAGIYLNGITNKSIILPLYFHRDGHVWHLFVIRTERRDELHEYLLKRDIQTQVHYPIAPHRQKAYHEWDHLELPITEKIHREVLSLPMDPLMSESEANTVAQELNKYGL